MGYEIKVIIGKSCLSHPEWKQSSVPYSDGSGFEPERDTKGNPVLTGRTMQYFMPYVEIDMCKLGYDSDPLNDLIGISFQLARKNQQTVHYFYGSDGNIQITEDKYGAAMHPVPLKDLQTALNAITDMSYRRLKWLKALVDSMADDKEELQAMFFGY